jgi:hypothetical protein
VTKLISQEWSRNLCHASRKRAPDGRRPDDRTKTTNENDKRKGNTNKTSENVKRKRHAKTCAILPITGIGAKRHRPRTMPYLSCEERVREFEPSNCSINPLSRFFDAFLQFEDTRSPSNCSIRRLGGSAWKTKSGAKNHKMTCNHLYLQDPVR